LQVSQRLASDEFFNEFIAKLESTGLNFEKALYELFVDFDKNFQDCQKAASTAAVCVFYDDFIYAANVGDSKSILLFDDQEAPVTLSEEHSCENLEELKRVKTKTRVTGGLRSKLYFVDAYETVAIRISRFFGGQQYKQLMQGMSCVPYIKTVNVTGKSFSLFLFTDGFEDLVQDKSFWALTSDPYECLRVVKTIKTQEQMDLFIKEVIEKERKEYIKIIREEEQLTSDPYLDDTTLIAVRRNL
jgi:serine/threonine protein phosphatase PrpC